MSGTHTPGPWEYSPSTLTPDFWCVESPDGDIVYLTLRPFEAEANARLIAAAPELLTALKAFTAIHYDDLGLLGPNEPETKAMALADAAIAKAEGKQ